MDTATGTDTDPLYEAVAALLGGDPSEPVPARDPVNLPTIRNWCDAMGDTNPIYLDADAAQAVGHPDIVAPPAALQAWTMPGLHHRGVDDPANRARSIMIDAGYLGVVATDCQQTYHRYLKVGDLLSDTTRFDAVSPRKQTALGEGYFLTTVTEYHDQHGELVGELLFRILWFKPGTARPKAPKETAS